MNRDLSEAQLLCDEIQAENGYPYARVLEDGSIAAIMPLIFTTSIILGINRTGYCSRFCFKDPLLAIQRFSELKSEDDEPQGYIARR